MSAEEKKILVAEDEANMRRILSAMLTREGFIVTTVENGVAALSLLKKENFAVVITDLKMPEMDGLQLLHQIRRKGIPSELILITAHGTIETAVEAMKRGAFDFITKPFDANELKIKASNAARTYEKNQLEARVRAVGLGKYNFIGISEPLQEICRVLDKVADSPSTILITGEPGTGKELIASAIHENSSRRNEAFIKINCAAIPENLVESELFGHEKGSFTGAVSSKPGRFELADRGTLFLDEIGEMPRELQVKLLRCLQEKEFERVGGLKVIRVDVRVIAATNKNLEVEVASGRFRQDLYYRLNVVPIFLPPLRDRIEDIEELVPYFVARFNKRLGRSVSEVTPAALAALRAYQWPGNIRELENIIERAILLSENEILDVEDLHPNVTKGYQTRPGLELLRSNNSSSLKDVVKEYTRRIERDFIKQTLAENEGNVTRTAEALGISRKSLQMKMKEYGLRNQRSDLSQEGRGRRDTD